MRKFILLVLSTLSASMFTYAQNYKIPVVSIDSVFKAEGFNQANDFGRRFTNAVSNILDSLSMDSAMVYKPNYKLTYKTKADFIVSGKLGPRQLISGAKVLGVQGGVHDNYSHKYGSEFGCFARTLTDISCFCYNARFPDSTNYRFLKGTLFSGLRVIMSLTPMHKVLSPINSEKAKGTFAVNQALTAESDAEKNAATALTQVINNILVYNQASYPTSVKRNYKHYNYYPNYRLDASEIQPASFTIEGELASRGENFEIQFKFGGKDVNLVAPEPLKTKISFNKKRFLSGDYSEAMFELTGILYSFILMNTMF